jgi:hypothetical protein
MVSEIVFFMENQTKAVGKQTAAGVLGGSCDKVASPHNLRNTQPRQGV